MSEQQPTIGRTVLYHHLASKDPNAPLFVSPAIVQKVSEDGDELTLCVFSVNGNVAFRKATEQGNKLGQWDWPVDTK